jgi:hypothetical protein
MGGTESGTSLVAAIIAMAHSLGLRVVAEGVETPAQVDALLRLGCDEAQGYLLGRPAPAAELTAVFGARRRRTKLVPVQRDRRATAKVLETKAMSVVAEAMRGRGDVEHTTRSLLDELERLIGRDRGD